MFLVLLERKREERERERGGKEGGGATVVTIVLVENFYSNSVCENTEIIRRVVMVGKPADLTTITNRRTISVVTSLSLLLIEMYMCTRVM